MTPSPSPSPSRTPPHAQSPMIEQALVQDRSSAQDDLLNAIKSINETEFDQLLDLLLADGASLEQLDSNGLTPLEIAVIAGRPGIVHALLDRNVGLPIVNEDGFDLLMLSASCGNTAMMTVLIDKGEMQCNAQDAKGLTPLHYAVLGGHFPAAVALLDRDANINQRTTGAIDRQICERFSIPPSLAQSGSTPLMLAVITGHLALADLLLSQHADATIGYRHPLELAIVKNDAAMIDLLIQRGIDPTTITLINGQSMLSLAVERKCSLACIKMLLPPHRVVNDQTSDPHSPLRIAIKSGQHDIAAYLLCQGAKIDVGDQGSETALAYAQQLSDQGKMMQILVATRCAGALTSFSLVNGTAIELCQTAHHPTALAALGFFPELLQPVATEVLAHKNALHLLTPEQQEVEIAYIMMRLTKPDIETHRPTKASTASVIPVLPEQRFIQSIPEKIAAQKNELYQWTKRIIDQKNLMMLNCFSRHFLRSMLEACPEGTNLSLYMSRYLREKEGMPEDLSNIIVLAWANAHKKVSEWTLEGADANSISICKEYHATHMMERTLFKQIQTLRSQGMEPSFSIQYLYDASGQRSLPTSQYAENPVRFLQLLAQDFTQPALHETQLTTALCLKTGWPPVECRKIIDVWKDAKKAVELIIPANDIERRDRFLCHEMASALKRLLPAQRHHPDGTVYPFPSRWETQLHRWCDTTLAQHASEAANPAVVTNEEETRPLKRARTQ
jgi:ankyrin repeat protein